MVPPWGGETAIDLLPLIDWEAERAAEPTWVVGYSDTSTVMTPLTLLTGVATLHGNNLMDAPYGTPEELVSWLDIVAAPPGHRFTQIPPELHRASGWDDWAKHPDARTLTLDVPGRWTRLDGSGDVDAVLVGRTSAADTASLTQHQAVLDALGPLDVPIVADVECGHVPPYLPLVHGARCQVVQTAARNEVAQTLE